MGSLHDWTRVALQGAFFGMVMALSTGPRKAPDGSKTGWSWADVVSSAMAGLFFGIGVTFHSRALHPPLVFILLLAVGGAFAVARLAPPKPPSIDKSPYRQ
jgi:anti-sigma-K factor RskA